MTAFHEPVLLKEALKFLNAQTGKKYIDATIGGAAHAVEIVKRGGILLGIDVDPDAVEAARKKLEVGGSKTDSEDRRWKLERGNFRNVDKIAKENDFYPVAGVLYDLGLSAYQLEHSGRGFSFQKDEPLDMRADPNLKVTAADLVNGLSEHELTKLFQKYGEEKYAGRIARAVVGARQVNQLRTGEDLSDLIVRVSPKGGKRIHPATKIFQALRIAVNDELNNLQSSLPQAFELLDSGGRLVVISFHSLEDRIVKNVFTDYVTAQYHSGAVRGKVLTKKPVTPSADEIKRNPRARSAKLRAIEKL